jgi:hypothetical protein
MSLSISVAMCTFNGSRFLPAQLQSIRDQSKLPNELVICDDRSSDGSDAIALKFAQHAPFPVRVVRNTRKLGSTKNFEKAISLCEGCIVALSDQDDVWYPSKLEQIEKAFQTPSVAPVAVFSDADLIDEYSRQAGLRLWQSFFFRRQEQTRFANGDALKILIKHPVVTGATLAFRKEFFHVLSPFPTNQVHDAWMTFLLAACGPVAPIAEPLMQYRRHIGQQIGPGRMNLLDRLRQSQKTGQAFYLDEVERFRQIAERLKALQSEIPGAELALREIEGKISHRAHRAQLSRAGIRRVPRVFREMINGGYWHYSEGWESIAKDITGLFANDNCA